MPRATSTLFEARPAVNAPLPGTPLSPPWLEPPGAVALAALQRIVELCQVGVDPLLELRSLPAEAAQERARARGRNVQQICTDAQDEDANHDPRDQELLRVSGRGLPLALALSRAIHKPHEGTPRPLRLPGSSPTDLPFQPRWRTAVLVRDLGAHHHFHFRQRVRVWSDEHELHDGAELGAIWHLRRVDRDSEHERVGLVQEKLVELGDVILGHQRAPGHDVRDLALQDPAGIFLPRGRLRFLQTQFAVKRCHEVGAALPLGKDGRGSVGAGRVHPRAEHRGPQSA
eukprot:scaffold2107_cov222-Pinguiococcus_pyrenoidosus.AAC.11